MPPVRVRRAGTLTAPEREKISRGLARGDSIRVIAGLLGRPASTVSREIARDKGHRKYRAVDAEDRAWDRGPHSGLGAFAGGELDQLGDVGLDEPFTEGILQRCADALFGGVVGGLPVGRQAREPVAGDRYWLSVPGRAFLRHR